MLKKINSMARSLSAIDRYSQTRLVNPESVLEHTGYVCLCCLFIGNELNNRGEDLNIGLLMTKATVHDL